jgi:site-specific DNA-cytosine methylase
MSCGRVALERAGIQVDKYFASEIDKYAIQVSQKNYPDNIHIGSVTDIRYKSDEQRLYWHNEHSCLLPIDLLIGGSPCQSFSIA